MAESKTVEIKKRDRNLVKEALRIERANGRRDTAKQKTRGEVSGGGVKPYKQKGTGRARQGSIRAVQWVGGGRAKNTVLENHHRKINKKARQKAMAAVLEWKKGNGKVMVDALQFDVPSTKQFLSFLSGKDLAGKVLFLYNSDDSLATAVKSARNIEKVKVLHVDAINMQDLLNTEWLLTVPAVAEQLNLN